MKKSLFLKKQVVSFSQIFWFLIIVIFQPLHAQEQSSLQLGNVFQDHMVLQRNKPINIWGKAEPGNKVTVSMNGEKLSTRAGDNGSWSIELPALAKKGPYTVIIVSNEEVEELIDVLIGDVWIASGQSNMEWPVRNTNFKEKDSIWIEKAEIRLLKVLPEMDYQPRKNASTDGWRTLTAGNILEFSAVAYHFGKLIHKNTEVPIGLISANLGATAIETWMSNEVISFFPQFDFKNQLSFEKLRENFEQGKEEWTGELYYSGIGMEQEWFQPSQHNSGDWKSMEVAGNTWEEVEDLRDFDGAVWFRKKFDIPQNFTGDSLNLKLLQIDDYDLTWVNGKKVGETFGRHNHRNYKVAISDLQEKDNLLVVRVFDTGGLGGFTTSAFWGNEILWGTWEYRKGQEIEDLEFISPDLPNVSPFSSPTVLYNGTIAPLTSLGITGVIWYQGESNELRAQEYGSLFPALIRDWRKQFGQGNFPFLFVQLANYREEPQLPQESLWAELRESQALALKEPNTGMAVAIDIGEAGDIHPRNKEEVGNRLGKLALNTAYDKNILARSPQFDKMELKINKVFVDFNYIGNGLINRNKYGYIRGFQIAGANKRFFWARAFLEGNKIVVWSPEVNDPVAVRYAWSDNPGDLDIYNSAGLPLAPFRTDQWELQTHGKVFEKGPRF